MPTYRITLKQRITETKVLRVEAPSREELTQELVYGDTDKETKGDLVEAGDEVYVTTPAVTDGWECEGVSYGDRWVDDIETVLPGHDYPEDEAA